MKNVKNIFKRNQVIITALAIMIAIAGYLRFAESNVGQNELQTTPQAEAVLGEISDEDLLAENRKDSEGETGEGETTTQPDDLLTSDDDIESNDLDLTTNETSKPGEAVLVSSIGNLTFSAQARLNREQVRAKNKATLLEIINNVNVTDAQKQSAIDSLIQITEISEKEVAAENLLEARGFNNAVVSITDGKADVIISMTNISDPQRAQIEDAVKSKTGLGAESIVITPMDSK